MHPSMYLSPDPPTLLHGLFLLSAACPFTWPYLADVAKSVDVWHRGGFVGAHHYFPRLLVELHAELVQAQGFGFRGSAWVQWKGKQGREKIALQPRRGSFVQRWGTCTTCEVRKTHRRPSNTQLRCTISFRLSTKSKSISKQDGFSISAIKLPKWTIITPLEKPHKNLRTARNPRPHLNICTSKATRFGLSC